MEHGKASADGYPADLVPWQNAPLLPPAPCSPVGVEGSAAISVICTAPSAGRAPPPPPSTRDAGGNPGAPPPAAAMDAAAAQQKASQRQHPMAEHASQRQRHPDRARAAVQHIGKKPVAAPAAAAMTQLTGINPLVSPNKQTHGDVLAVLAARHLQRHQPAPEGIREASRMLEASPEAAAVATAGTSLF